MNANKQSVQNFWNEAACGEALLLPTIDKSGYESQAAMRYSLEPYILTFAKFSEAADKDVLEIGVGLGADHQQFALAGAKLSGIDLTERAVTHTKHRLNTFGLSSHLAVGDAENLVFENDSFDLVYSWGVIHHSPDTPKAIAEINRVLKPGGRARVMIYHTWSMVGLMLWMRYALLRFRPWISMTQIYSQYLESPGTKAYTIAEARHLFSAFDNVSIQTVLTHGDLLESGAGQRHEGVVLNFARKIWPRSIIRKFFPSTGLFMLIDAVKK